MSSSKKQPRKTLPSLPSTDSEDQNEGGTDTSGGIITDEALDENICLETDSAVSERLDLASTTIPEAPTAPILPVTAGSSSQS